MSGCISDYEEKIFKYHRWPEGCLECIDCGLHIDRVVEVFQTGGSTLAHGIIDGEAAEKIKPFIGKPLFGATILDDSDRTIH